jgi:hypothetical protein
MVGDALFECGQQMVSTLIGREPAFSGNASRVARDRREGAIGLNRDRRLQSSGQPKNGP